MNLSGYLLYFLVLTNVLNLTLFIILYWLIGFHSQWRGGWVWIRASCRAVVSRQPLNILLTGWVWGLCTVLGAYWLMRLLPKGFMHSYTHLQMCGSRNNCVRMQKTWLSKWEGLRELYGRHSRDNAFSDIFATPGFIIKEENCSPWVWAWVCQSSRIQGC